MAHRTRPATLIALLGLATLACDGPSHAEAARTPFERLYADSLAGDSAAFAALPRALRGWLDVRTLVDPASWDSIPGAVCNELEPSSLGLRRRRLSLRLPADTVVVVYAVADGATGALDRVEYIRRTPKAGQRGLVWDAARDRTQSTWWAETPWGLSRRVERGDIPRGGPVPRAMRGLGRRLFTLRCDADPDAAVPTPAETPR